MSYQTYYKKGTCNAECQDCGFQYKLDQLVKHPLTKVMVCKKCWEPYPEQYKKLPRYPNEGRPLPNATGEAPITYRDD